MANRLMLVLGFVLALGAGFIVWNTMAETQQVRAATQVFQLRQTGTGVAAGDTIRAERLETVSIPAGFDGFLKHAIEATPQNRTWLNGRTATRPIPAGAVLTYDRFLGVSATRFDQMIPEGSRAVTIQVNVANTVNNNIGPGNRIDVLAIIADSGTTEAQYILRDVQTLAVGTASDWESYLEIVEEGYSTITLELCESEALRYATLRNRIEGGMTIVLRNQSDPRLDKPECEG